MLNDAGDIKKNTAKRRVVITGVGLVTPLGVGTLPNWEALLAGQSGIGPITKFDTARFSTRIAGEVKGFDPLDFVDRKEVRKMDPFIQYAVAAAHFAVEDSGHPLEASASTTGAGSTSARGSAASGRSRSTHKVLLEKGPDRVSPFFLISTIINEAAGQISIRYGAKGPNSASVTACTTATHCIGDSFRLIVRGDADVMIAGGAEAPITPLGVAGFCAMKALSERNDEPAAGLAAVRRARDGFVMGEGAGILLLEELGHALRRGAKIYAEIVGYGMTGDAYHVAAPAVDGDGAERVMRLALDDAGDRRPGTSSSSTPTARRPRSTTRSRRRPSSASSGSTPPSSP